jgi:uncharacterized membrane protein
MSELVVLGFESKYKADEVLLELLKSEQETLLDLEDALVITKNAEGKIRVKPCHDLVKPGDLSNELWGGIISSVVYHRSLEILDDPNTNPFDPNFLLEVETLLQPNSSALFILIRRVSAEKVLPIFRNTGGKLLQTTYTEDKAAKLQEYLN